MYDVEAVMNFKSSKLKDLEEIYSTSGNQIVLLYGRKDCEKEWFLKKFVEDKKSFYYRCRQIAPKEQAIMMGEEVSTQFDVRLQTNTYAEYFKRIKSGDPSKFVLVIDEAQFLLKKDPSFLESIIKLKERQLYPGPVMVILAVSSLVWMQKEYDEILGGKDSKVDAVLRLDDMNFLEVVRAFPTYSVSETIRVYGVLGGVPGYLNQWDVKESFEDNICRLVLSKDGYLFNAAEQLIRSELREISVYNTILHEISQGNQKLNDLHEKTGYSRAKISVYMKNLNQFDIVEKVISFQTGGWENAKKGVYQIKDTFIHFWYKFVFPHQSELYMLEPKEFYQRYIKDELDAYLNRTFQTVCMEYLFLLNQIHRLPIEVSRMGTWIGKSGNIDIIAQSSIRKNIVCLCNWEQNLVTTKMYEDLLDAVAQAKISADYVYLFSAKAFSPDLIQLKETYSNIELIDMNEL